MIAFVGRLKTLELVRDCVGVETDQATCSSTTTIRRLVTPQDTRLSHQRSARLKRAECQWQTASPTRPHPNHRQLPTFHRLIPLCSPYSRQSSRFDSSHNDIIKLKMSLRGAWNKTRRVVWGEVPQSKEERKLLLKIDWFILSYCCLMVRHATTISLVLPTDTDF